LDATTKLYTQSWVTNYDFYRWEISKGFGLTYSYYGDANQMREFKYELLYARINGNEYGDPVSVRDLKMLPMKYTLFQNYPNPFNPATRIKFTIPVSGLVRLKVYTMLGSEITDLVNEELPAGSYEVEFKAPNLPSGVYFFRLQSGNFVDTKKLLLIR